MNRQYIGARYVPKIFSHDGSSEWLKGIAYESLTIVTYLGNSYTSKTAVPSNIGAPNVNSEYWVNTGNYNAQIESYRNDVEILTNRVNIFTSQSDDRFKNLEYTKIQNIQSKRWLFVGDSYAFPESSWVENVVSLLGITNYKKSASGGSSFVNKNGFPTFLELMNSGWAEGDNFDCVVVAGGYNEMDSVHGNTALLPGGIDGFVSAVRGKNPKCEIFLGMIGNGVGLPTLGIPKIQKLYEEGAIRNKINYMYGAEYVMHFTGNMNADLIHPNDNGTRNLGYMIAECIMHGHCNYCVDPITYNVVAPDGSTVSCTIQFGINNGIGNILVNGSANGTWSGTLASTKFDGATTIPLGTVEESICSSLVGIDLYHVIIGRIGTNLVNANGRIIINGRNVGLQIVNYENGSPSAENVNGIIFGSAIEKSFPLIR